MYTKKKNRLSKEDYRKKRAWFFSAFPYCQHPNCNNFADDNHHIFYGAYKNDFCLINLCREHHIWAHNNKKASIALYEPIGLKNEEEFNLSLM